MAKKENFYLRDQRGKSGAGERGSGVAKQNAGFASSCLLADSAIKKEGD